MIDLVLVAGCHDADAVTEDLANVEGLASMLVMDDIQHPGHQPGPVWQKLIADNQQAEFCCTDTAGHGVGCVCFKQLPARTG
jgi:hypothetical protein